MFGVDSSDNTTASWGGKMTIIEGTVLLGRRNMFCVDNQLCPLHFLGFCLTLRTIFGLHCCCYSAGMPWMMMFLWVLFATSFFYKKRHFFASYISDFHLKMPLIHCILTARLTSHKLILDIKAPIFIAFVLFQLLYVEQYNLYSTVLLQFPAMQRIISFACFFKIQSYTDYSWPY